MTLADMLPALAALIGSVLGNALALSTKFSESFFETKGANLATKQDIEAITHLVESVKAQHARLLEEQQTHNRLRLAAVEKRLEAHQMGFALWRKLLAHANDDRIRGVVTECQEWWSTNCLYLDKHSREAFVRAYNAAFTHREVSAGPGKSEDSWNTIIAAGEALVRGVDLPSLGKLEHLTLEATAQLTPIHS